MSHQMSEQEARQTLLELLQDSLEDWRSSDHGERDNVMQLSQYDFDRFATVLGWAPAIPGRCISVL